MIRRDWEKMETAAKFRVFAPGGHAQAANEDMPDLLNATTGWLDTLVDAGVIVLEANAGLAPTRVREDQMPCKADGAMDHLEERYPGLFPRTELFAP